MESNAVVAARGNADGERDQLFAFLVESVLVQGRLRQTGESLHHLGATLPQGPQRCVHRLRQFHPIGGHGAPLISR
jgi:hypothetical protein